MQNHMKWNHFNEDHLYLEGLDYYKHYVKMAHVKSDCFCFKFIQKAVIVLIIDTMSSSGWRRVAEEKPGCPEKIHKPKLNSGIGKHISSWSHTKTLNVAQKRAWKLPSFECFIFLSNLLLNRCYHCFWIIQFVVEHGFHPRKKASERTNT